MIGDPFDAAALERITEPTIVHESETIASAAYQIGASPFILGARGAIRAGFLRAGLAANRARTWGLRGEHWTGDLSVVAAANHEAENWIAAVLYLIGAP